MSIQALRTGATGMRAMEMNLDVIANNIANVNTTAFKRSRANFENLFYQYIKLPGAQDAFNNYAPTGLALGLGARVQGTQIMFQQGSFITTNNQLDVAIDGDGFFQVIDPSTNNFLYTRAGNFAVNSNGVLVIGSSNTGRVIQPQITIPIDTTGILISAEGNVSIQQFGQTQFSQVGQLQMAKFLNEEGLLAMGENLYQETLSSGAAIFGQPGTNGLGTLNQNMLESSNVDPTNELIDLITTQRAFELNSQTVQAGDQMLQLINNLRRF
ncbi:MAG TPA: flagellar basal-body rod protein FlgG [Pirellulales bacterium]|nr:flagellar basal-body rod protein FlgG [Pirellulales bacterium]